MPKLNVVASGEKVVLDYIIKTVKAARFVSFADIAEGFVASEKLKDPKYATTRMVGDLAILPNGKSRLAKAISNSAYRGNKLLDMDISSVAVRQCKKMGKLYKGQPINKGAYITTGQASKSGIPTSR